MAIKKQSPLMTIIMPVYNGATTLERVFAGLEMQEYKDIVSQLIIIDDNSNDGSAPIIEAYAKKSSLATHVITHEASHGLAAGYNEGIALAKTPYVTLMHQDIVLTKNDSFARLVQPLQDAAQVVASYPVLLHPYEVWREYSFWQKCLFSRYVGKKLPVLTGKFDCFSKKFIDEVGGFDNKTYRTAGEDSDLKVKIKQRGFSITNSGVEVIHLQYAEKDFGLKKWIKKEAQLAEAQGVVLRRHGIYDVRGLILSFFRQILLVGLLVPYLRWLCMLLIVGYTITYTKLVYLKEYKNPRIVLVPFINVFLLFVALEASARGFIRGKQVI